MKKTKKLEVMISKQNPLDFQTIAVYRICAGKHLIISISNIEKLIKHIEKPHEEKLNKCHKDMLEKHGIPTIIITSKHVKYDDHKVLTPFTFDDHNYCLCTEKFEISLKFYMKAINRLIF